MLSLIQDIRHDLWQRSFSKAQDSVAILPPEPEVRSMKPIYIISTAPFEMTDTIGDRHLGRDRDSQMNMVLHTAYSVHDDP